MNNRQAALPPITQSALFGEQKQDRYELLPIPCYHPSSSVVDLPSSSASPTSMVFPTASTVVIGKGSVPKKATGNSNLRNLVREKIPEYVNASSKMVKSSIVTDIYFAIEEACLKECSSAAFVRYDRKGYQRCSESIAREKITSTFRDCLHDKYKSSTKSKVARRRLANKKKAEKKLHASMQNKHQQGFIEISTLPIHQQSYDECPSPSSALKRSDFLPQPQHQLLKPHQQQLFYENETANNSFKNLFKNLFSSNLLPERSPNTGSFSAPLIEFDRSFIDIDMEPTPIPELDSASSCSSCSDSCSHQQCPFHGWAHRVTN